MESTSTGKGRWKDILLESQHVFKDRTTMDLKDKWRNIERMAQKERAREEAAAEDSEGGRLVVATLQQRDKTNEM